MSSILSGYLSLLSRAEAAQIDTDVIVATDEVSQEARVMSTSFAIKSEPTTEYVVRSLSIRRSVSGLGSD
jgi:hypothetical protein